MQTFDYVVIGGGIVGLSVAAAILERTPSARLAVIEKESDWARHQTGRNSGVIHSGIYYKPGSLKADMCQRGNRRLIQFCDAHRLPYEICGKLIVATNEAELPRLDALLQRGLQHGLPVRMLTRGEAREIEPHAECVRAIHVPSTGIVDYRRVCSRLAELIKLGRGTLCLGTRLLGVTSIDTGTILHTSTGDVFTTKYINCAGLHSDRVGAWGGQKRSVRIVPFRGEYYELKPERRGLVRGLIYPVPDPQFPFLGVHFTRMIDGSVHAGPNAVLSLKREGYSRGGFSLRDSFDTLTFPGFWRLVARHGAAGLQEVHRSFSKRAFVCSLRRLIPEIRSADLIPSQPGIRAQAVAADGALVDDFLIRQTRDAVHVCNAPSPAATASLEIGRTVAELVLSEPRSDARARLLCPKT
jgi:L-2-hydroxyglutarate oxidase